MWYKLDEHGEPVEADSAEAFGDPRRIIAQDDLAGGVCVSTVFLVLDHSFGDGPAILWETMVFGGKHHLAEWRYTSRSNAVAGHAAAVALVLSDIM